jgi:hypothetical protein
MGSKPCHTVKAQIQLQILEEKDYFRVKQNKIYFSIETEQSFKLETLSRVFNAKVFTTTTFRKHGKRTQ